MKKIETPYDRETIKEEQEKIKAANQQIIINILEAKGIDKTKIPRHEFDKLLRIIKEDTVLREKHNKLMSQFSEIVAPYKIAVSPDLTCAEEKKKITCCKKCNRASDIVVIKGSGLCQICEEEAINERN